MSRIHIETFGEGQPIVLVHGWAMHSGVWLDFARALSKAGRVICIDLPGHGRSEPIESFTLELVARALADAVDEKACWLGWSMGAEIVLAIARQFPDRVNQLILLAGSPCFLKKDNWPGVDGVVLDEFALNLKIDAEPALSRFLAWQVQGLVNWQSYLEKLSAMVFEYGMPDAETLLSGLTLLKNTDLRPALAQLTIPVAVVLGGKDTLIPVAVGAKLQDLKPQLELTVIKRAGHAPFLSHQGEVAGAVRGFMERHASS